MVQILVPIFICVVLPLGIVFIVFRASMNSDNKRAEILIKAIEANNGIDADKLAESIQKPKKSEREILNSRLLYGCVFTLLGIASTAYGLYATFSSSPDEDIAHFAFLISCVTFGVGLGFLITYFLTRKQINCQEEKN